mgnify:CR=1 FL=1
MNIIRYLIVILCFYSSIISETIRIHCFRTLFSRSFINLSRIYLSRNFRMIIWLCILLLSLRNIECHLSLWCCLFSLISFLMCCAIIISIIRILNILTLLFIYIALRRRRTLRLIFIINSCTIYKFIHLSSIPNRIYTHI